MSNANLNEFAELWNSFITKFKGQALSQAMQGRITCPALQMILNDLVLDWDSTYKSEGRWLDNLQKQYPEAGKEIHKIICNDMRFASPSQNGAGSFAPSNAQLPSGNTHVSALVLTAGSAAAGMGLAHLLGRKLPGKAAAALLFGGTAGFVSHLFSQSSADNYQQDLLQQHLAQLEQYRQQVISILNQLESNNNNYGR
ncbi:MAG: hypothetical protein Q4F00_12720 [bacterium]|nr:hypothetical protein [bacterium]